MCSLAGEEAPCPGPLPTPWPPILLAFRASAHILFPTPPPQSPRLRWGSDRLTSVWCWLLWGLGVLELATVWAICSQAFGQGMGMAGVQEGMRRACWPPARASSWSQGLLSLCGPFR